jgi:hypothetical protein
MSLPRPADVPALATRATLPDLPTPDRPCPGCGVTGPLHVWTCSIGGFNAPPLPLRVVPEKDDAERLATWDRVLP